MQPNKSAYRIEETGKIESVYLAIERCDIPLFFENAVLNYMFIRCVLYSIGDYVLLKLYNMGLTYFAALAQGVIKDNITAWMTVYFADTFGINLSKISGFVLFIPIVGLIGRLAYPVIYNVCNENEHKDSLIGFLISIFACGMLLIQKSSPVISIVALSLIYTAVSLINTSLLSVFPMGFVKTGNVASVSGLMDFATYFGAGIGSVIFGYTLVGLGYAFMFASWAIISVSALIPITVLIKNRCKKI